MEHLARTLRADPGFDELARRVAELSGVAFFADRPDELAERVARRCTVRGCNQLGDYRALLELEADGAERDDLTAELAIGETCFFRHPEQLAVFECEVLPRLIELRRGVRSLRIWSAGCASGAEPYTFAALIRRALGAAAGAWRLTILGSDVDPKALAQAREASYSAWALRSVGPCERAASFTADEQRWRLSDSLRRAVVFERHNLVADPFEPPLGGGYDLIVCRNVFIYLDPAVAQRIAVHLADALAPGGWLMLGHAEARQAPSHLDPLPSPAGALFQRPAEQPFGRRFTDRPESPTSATTRLTGRRTCDQEAKP